MPKKENNEQFELLSAEAKDLHSRLKREWNIRDAAGLVTLLTACQALDRLRQAQAILAKEGCIAADRFGQAKQHPASVIEKEARAGFLAALKHLNLDIESLEGGNAKKT
jgi:P27 family predicted phage terminase small subunit